MFCFVRGYGGWRVWRIMVSPTCRTPVLSRPMHARPVWCWPACVRSVYGHVVAAAGVLLVCGRVCRLMVGLFVVGSLALQQALAQSDLVRVGALLVLVLVGSSCAGPAWYVVTVRRPPTMGDKSNNRWFDRCKKFVNSVPHSLSRPGSVTCTTHHPVLRSALWPSFQLRLCHSYLHPRRSQGPVSPPWLVPVLPIGAPGCRSGSLLRCSCSCLPAWRALYRAEFHGLCGWCVCVAVLSRAVRVVRAARRVLWYRDAPSGVAGWVRRDTSVPAGRGWRVRGARVASLWPLACPGWGFGGKKYWAVLKPRSRFLTLLAFCGDRVPRTILAGYMCRIPPDVPGVQLSRRRCALVPAGLLSLDSSLGR